MAHAFDCSYRYSRRARRLSLRVVPPGEVVVTLPLGFSMTAAEKFALDSEAWIRRQLRRLASRKDDTLLPGGRPEFRRLKEAALRAVAGRLEIFSRQTGLKFGRVSIKDNRSVWGSCSKTGNLNFCYKIAYLPPHLVDYIAAHELCHLRHFNHSRSFWREVAALLPDFEERRAELRKYRMRAG